MSRVLVTYAGGRLSIGLARALATADAATHIVGVDANPYQLQRAAAHERYLVPRADQHAYLSTVLEIIDRARIDVVWPNHEAEIAILAEAGAGPVARTFLPPPDVIRLCQDKMASYDGLRAAGVPVPASLLITDDADLAEAFRGFGGPVWLRAIKGAGGKGSRAVPDVETGRLWVELHKGWGTFMAAECLTPETVTWESIWHRGELILAQGRKRLYWEFASLTPSGVTGIAGAVQWVSDPAVDEIGEAAVRALAGRPHGVFSVDITYDDRGRPRVTEINCGRFMSGGIAHFPRCGYNAPAIATQLALEQPLDFVPPVLNPYPEEVVLVHGMDVEPIVTTVDEARRLEAGLEARLRGVPR